MKIRLAIIPHDDVASVMRLTDDLRTAVNAGNMDGVDAATKKLLAVTARMRSIDITEEEWRRFQNELRAEVPPFQSDYLISGSFCSQYFGDVTADRMVLQFPFSESEVTDV